MVNGQIRMEMTGMKRSGRFGKYVVLGFFLLVFSGCAGTYSLVEFEVLEPATIRFPDEVDQLLILNRSPVTFKVLSPENREGLERKELWILDTLVSNNVMRGLLYVLRNSPVKRYQFPIFLSERRLDTLFQQDLLLTKREVASLCERAGTDAVVSLERYSLDLEEHYDFYSAGDDGVADVAVVRNHYYIFSNRIDWAVYLPLNPRPFDEYTTIDTLYFSRISEGVFQGAPSSAEMIRELFYESGLKYGRYLVPVWAHASRTLFKGDGKLLRTAARHTRRGEWEQAFALWDELGESGDSTLAAKAFHNMAVYYELEDQLDSASLMIDRALACDSLEMVIFYREEMDIRLMNRREVVKQVIH